MFDNLGFVVHREKSKFNPSQEIVFLGFRLNSVKMTIPLTESKSKKLKLLFSKLLTIKAPTLRFLAKVIGTLVCAFPAVKDGPLHYRQLENNKTYLLKLSKGNFDAVGEINQQARNELVWWKKDQQLFSWIHPPKIELEY